MGKASLFYWLISAPKKDNPYEALSSRLTGQLLEPVSRFRVPELRVGTLDSLMQLSDDLVRHDSFVESVCRKIASQIFSLFENTAHAMSVGGASPETYLTHFEWDEAKFPLRSSLNDLVDAIKAQVGRMDEEFKHKSNEYSQLSQTIAAYQRKLEGSLAVRDLDDVVTEEHMVDTENMCSVFVVVPKYMYKDFESNYEKLCDMVVPRSSLKIYEDSESGLFRCVVFKRWADNFKLAARDRRYVIREVKLNPEGHKADAEAKEKMISDRDENKSQLILWCKTNFAEAMINWVHLKCIRVFVESILRYGLPVSFDYLLLLPPKKDDKKTRDTLNTLFKHLASASMIGGDADESATVAAAAGAGAGEKFYPYVYFPVNLDFHSSS